jgi:hypothetical protein
MPLEESLRREDKEEGGERTKTYFIIKGNVRPNAKLPLTNASRHFL